jgi:hypothetical protein
MADSNIWAPVVASGITGVVTLFGSWLAQWMTSGRESRARQHEAAEQEKRQRLDFQIKTLLELQEAVYGLMQQALNLNSIDGMLALSTAKPEDSELKQETEKYQLAHSRTTILRVRTQDEGVRIGTSEFVDSLVRLMEPVEDSLYKQGFEKTKADVTAIRSEVLRLFSSLNDRIGDKLRALY